MCTRSCCARSNRTNTRPRGQREHQGQRLGSSTTTGASAERRPTAASRQGRRHVSRCCFGTAAWRRQGADEPTRSRPSPWCRNELLLPDHLDRRQPLHHASHELYLTHRSDEGAAVSTLRAARFAIAAAHRDAGLEDPTWDHEGIARTDTGRERGQAPAFTADGLAAILATACIPRRTGRGLESDEQAEQRGAIDKAIAGLLFQAGLRRSEAAALRWADVQDGSDGRGVLVYVCRSKTDQDGTAADVRYLKNECAAALRGLRDRITVQRSRLRPEPTDQVLGGLNGQSIARRLAAAARSAGAESRITGHSGRCRPRLRAYRPWRLHPPRDHACRRLENGPHGRPLQLRHRRAGRRRQIPVTT